MSRSPVQEIDFNVISRALAAWFQFYDVEPENKMLHALTRAASELYADGYQSSDDLTTSLIGTYVGPWSLKINAATSASVH